MAAARSTRLSGLDRFLLVALLPVALLLAWTAGVFDSDIARTVRTSSVYVEPGAEVDATRAAEVIGDRRLILVYLATELGDRGGEICDDLESAVDGNLVVILGDDLESYGCALIPGRDDENFGKAAAAEIIIARGITLLEGDKTESAKIMSATYDGLVRAGNLPADARVLRAPAASYIVAAVLVGTVAAAAIGINLAGRRLGSAAADDAAARRRRQGAFSRRDAALAAAGARILELDAAYADLPTGPLHRSNRRLVRDYRLILREYLRLCRQCEGDSTDEQVRTQVRWITTLRAKIDDLAEQTPRGAG